MSDISVLEHYLAPLKPLLEADGVTEVVVNRPGEVGVETAGLWSWHAAPVLTAAWLRTLAVAAAAFTRQDVSASQPICSTVLPDGARCQIVLPPVAPEGTVSLTIRRPSQRLLTLDDLARDGLFGALGRPGETGRSLTDAALIRLRDAGDWPGFFRLAVQARRNILISGATGSGKTTFARALTALIPPEERLVTIEDTREFVLPHRNVVHMVWSKDGQGEARVDVRALLESALRMRPDRVLLQELRDGSAFFFLRSVNSGHPGSITTVHADSAALAFEQLTLLVRESAGGRDLPRDDVRALLHLLIDVVVQIRRDGAQRRVSEVWHEPARAS